MKIITIFLKTLAIIAFLILLKGLWVVVSTMGQGSFEGEKTEILRRRNYLAQKLVTSPETVLNEMPSVAGSTVRGWKTNHYLLANLALVGEAITLAMRTSVPWFEELN